MATLTIKNVQKRYGTVAVLKGIDLELHDGEFLVLLGPSGCGKSTLLNMIAGLDTVTDGAIEIDGRVINDIHPKDRDIAMVFQSYALYPNMSVARNIAFGLEMRGMSKPDREVAVKKVAALLQMEHLLDRKPAQLSGGQRQRVAMGRALVRDPKVFLFDEPLSNLDAKLRVDMRTEIKKLHQRLGTTIVYVTHDQIEAMTLATRIAIMKEGVVQQFAPPQEVYEQPANIYVASFIGSPAMNFIPAHIVSEADRIGVRIDGAQGASVLPIPAPSAAVLKKVGHDVILGVRPETIARYQHGTNLPPNFARFSAQVSVTEPTGADTLTYLALGGRDAIARVPPKEAPNAGEVAEFTVDMARACLFDPKTEQRVG